MKELVETIQEAIKERLRCPFTSVFMLSFLAFNWRILLSIFFVATPKGTSIADSVTARIGLVEGMEVQYLWPLGFSIAYVAVTPWIHWGVEFGQSFARTRHKKLRINEDKEIDIARIEAEKETERLRIEARRLRAERLEIDQESTETVISGFEDRLAKLQEKLSEFDSIGVESRAEEWAKKIHALREGVTSMDREIATYTGSDCGPKSLDATFQQAIRAASVNQLEQWRVRETQSADPSAVLVLSALPRLPFADATESESESEMIQSAATRLSLPGWSFEFSTKLGVSKAKCVAKIIGMYERLVSSETASA